MRASRPRRPFIPPDRLRPPAIDWSERLRQQDDATHGNQIEQGATAEPATTEPAADELRAGADPVTAGIGADIATEGPFSTPMDADPAAPPDSSPSDERPSDAASADAPRSEAEAAAARKRRAAAPKTPAPLPSEPAPVEAAAAEPEPASAVMEATREPFSSLSPKAEADLSREAGWERRAGDPVAGAGVTATTGRPDFDALVAPERVRLQRPAPPAPALRSAPSSSARRRWRRQTGRLDGRVAGVLIMTALAAACVVLLVLNVQRINESRGEAAHEAATYSPRMPDTSAPPPAGPPLVTVLGGDTVGAGDEAVPSTELLKNGLGGIDVHVETASSAHYAGTGSGDLATFLRLVKRIDPASTVVVLFGGSNDRSDPTSTLDSAAERTIRAVEHAAPDARVVIVGPVWASSTAPPEDLLQVRSTLRAAAGRTSAAFIDPVAGKWLQGRSGSGPLAKADRKELARRLTSALAAFTK
jgi:hypothetical protein